MKRIKNLNYKGIAWYSSTDVPKDEIWTISTSNMDILEDYVAYIPCKNRFITALRALFTGKVKWVWQVPSRQKDKTLKTIGKKLELRWEQ